MKTLRTFCLVLLFGLLVQVPAVPGESVDPACFSTQWPHDHSDLKPDPRLHFGRLDNGFRYVLLHNTEPRDRVGMYLDVLAGSLNERDDQRGIAHFLEHMVFNGSTHFKPGELIAYFQSLGMSFGGDTNARTGYDETVYNIILPNGSKTEIEKGLLVISDYARGAALLPAEIDRERGVILSEKRARDSAAYRTQKAATAFTLKGTMIPERLPIGVADVLEKADRNVLKTFYDAWYRPENMILVLVGDFDVKTVEPIIREQFAGLAAVGDRPACPRVGELTHNGLETFYHHEPELGETTVSLETLWNEPEHNDSYALQIQEVKKQLAAAMFGHRLEKLAEDPKTPFTGSGYANAVLFGRFGYGAISATTDPSKWQEALKVLDRTLRQALQFGFSEAEFQRVKTELLAQIDAAVATAGTRNSMNLASDLIRDINDNRVFQSPAQEKELFAPAIEKLTLAEVQEAFAAVWAHPNRLIEVNGNTAIAGPSPQAAIAEVYGRVHAEPVQDEAAAATVAFPYLHFPAVNAPPRSDVPLAGIDAEKIVFANGVILNLKKTDFKKNSLEVRVDFGDGKRSEPTPGLAALAQAVVNGSGSAKMRDSDFDRVLAGSSISRRFQVLESCFSWTGGALAKDAEQLFQVLQTLIADPGIREDAYTIARENFNQTYQGLARDINGAMPLHVQKFLMAGYPHAGLPSWKDFSALSLAQIREWILPAVTKSPLEVSVVGDFDREQLVALVGKYFGALPARTPLPGAEEVTVGFPEGKTLEVKVGSSIDKGMVVVAWPTADFSDISKTRRLNILAAVLSDRLRKKVREQLGAAYSPVVFNASSRVFPGYGLMEAQVIAEPGALNAITKIVLAIGDDLVREGCTEDELERAKAPTLTALKDMVRTNGYWLNTVLALSARYPQQLEWPLTIQRDFASIRKEEISSLAASYLREGRAAVAIITPEQTGKEGSPAPLSHNP